MPKISVIIPVYNVEKYLVECLDSVIHQTFKDIEIICINDGSTDNSLDILEEYAKKDKRLIIINKKNEGVSIARNIGIDYATGDYIHFLDADDLIDNNFYKNIFDTIRKKNLDIYMVGHVEYFKNTIKDSYTKEILQRFKNKKKIKDSDLIINFFHGVWNKVYKTNFIKNNKIKFPENIEIAEDSIFGTICVLNKPRFDFTEKCYYFYRTDNTKSKTNSLKNNVREELKAHLYIKELKIYKKAPLKIQRAIDLRTANGLSYQYSKCSIKRREQASKYIKYYIKFLESKYGNSIYRKKSFQSLYQCIYKTIPLVIASDNSFSLATTACLYSILEKTNSFIDIYLLSDNISNKNKKLIKSSLKNFNNYNLSFIDMNNYNLKQFPEIQRFKKSCFSRFFIPEICVEYDKVIYTDADVLFMDNIQKYYDIDLEDYGIAAVSEEIGKPIKGEYNIQHRKKILNISKSHNFFANGNIIISCNYWRKHNITEKLINKIKELKDCLICPDLDVMNILFENNYKILDFKYCCCVHRINDIDNSKEMQDGFTKPFIIHYSGKLKPWQASEVLFQDEFVKICKKFNKHFKLEEVNYSNFVEKIFSIKNSRDKNHKVITIFGIRIKIKKNCTKFYKKIYKNALAKHQKVLDKLIKNAKSRKIRVCFLVSETQKWNLQELYNKLENSSLFEPIIIVTALKNLSYRNSYEHNITWFKSRCKNVELGYDVAKQESIDINSFDPDIIFYQQPWDIWENQSPEHVLGVALTYYVPYSVTNTSLFLRCNLEKFYLILYKHFMFDNKELKKYQKTYKYKFPNFCPIGHPKLDVYNNYNKELYGNKYVIYAPHHSFDPNSLNYGTFTWNGKIILEWAKNNRQFDWIFKPHPRLKVSLIENGIMTSDEVEEYYKEWSNLGLYYNDGDYFNIFKNSKCLITDCGSFLTEYLPTGKPVIHLRNLKAQEYSVANQVAIKSYYQAKNSKELMNLLNTILIKNKDYKKKNRIKAMKKIGLNSFNTTEKIIQKLYELL